MRSVLIIGTLVALLLSACAEESKPRLLREEQAEAALRELWQTIVPTRSDTDPRSKAPEWQMNVTTWLPSEWPPSPRTIWTRYAYALDVSHDGSCDVAAPFARMERKAGEARDVVFVPMARQFKVIGVHPVRPTAGWHYSLDDEKQLLAVALSLTREPPAQARGTLGMTSYFQSWRRSHAVIAGHLTPHHHAFFAWLTQQ